MQTLPPIESLLPHAGPMCWLDRVVDGDETSIAVEARIRPDLPVADALGMPAWAGIELMAQAIAAWAGLRAHARGQAAKPGFLLGTRVYRCDRVRFKFGMRLRIEANCEFIGDNGLGAFACRILHEGTVVANANVSVFEPDDVGGFLGGTET